MKQVVQRAGRLALALLVAGTVALNSCKSDSTTTVYGNWTKSSAFAGPARRAAVTFTIGSVAYVGTGIDANGLRYRDFWSFDPSTGGWTLQASLPAAAARYSAVAFAANGKGYVGTGLDQNNLPLADFWEFTPSSTGGSWRQVASMPANTISGAVGRYGALAGSLNNVGYVGFGNDGNTEKDIYSFTPPTTATGMGMWSVLAGPAAFPGDKRVNGVAFVIGSNMYVATGTSNSQNVVDVYAFNGTSWTAKNRLINQTSGTIFDYSAVARTGAVAFAVGDKGYLATGSTSTTCYQYDPAADTWTLLNPFVGAARSAAIGFGINGYGYVGLGANGSTAFDDFYQLDPNVVQQ